VDDAAIAGCGAGLAARDERAKFFLGGGRQSSALVRSGQRRFGARLRGSRAGGRTRRGARGWRFRGRGGWGRLSFRGCRCGRLRRRFGRCCGRRACGRGAGCGCGRAPSRTPERRKQCAHYECRGPHSHARTLRRADFRVNEKLWATRRSDRATELRTRPAGPATRGSRGCDPEVAAGAGRAVLRARPGSAGSDLRAGDRTSRAPRSACARRSRG
jgi:hypothetical protein